MVSKRVLAVGLASIIVIGSIVAALVVFYPWDTTEPVVTIVRPIEGFYADSIQLLEIVASDNIQIDSIWYDWDGSNVTYTGPEEITFLEGTTTIYAWANDTAGNVGSTSVTFTVDTAVPSVAIVSPTAGMHFESSWLLEITASDTVAVDTVWYNWEGVNVAYTGPEEIVFPDGTTTIHAWANDTAGNVGSASVTITTFSSAELFVSDWNTTLTSEGSSDSNQVKLPLEAGGTYQFLVDWGDGLSDMIDTWNQPEVTHSYTSAGVYTIRIGGTLVGWRFNNEGDRLKLIEISQWGQVRLGNSGSYFSGCLNLNLTAKDSLNLTGTTSLFSIFFDCEKLGTLGNMNGWDVSRITNMSEMFYAAFTFNQNISAWNVSSVIDMGDMFYYASAFNQDISAWDVSSVVDMTWMFEYAEAFNQDISAWDVSSVTNMLGMFYNASAFNQSIGAWDVSSVTDMSYMFGMTLAFNQNISSWNVSSVTDMRNMFYLAQAFNQSIGAWDVSSVTDMSWMFSGVTLSTANYDSLLLGWANLTLQYGVNFHGGGSKYSAGSAAAARQYIIDTYGWIIQDGGQA